MAPPSALQSALEPRGREATLLGELGAVLFVGGTVVFALVVAVLLVALVARKKSVEEQSGSHAAHSPVKRWAVGIAAGLTALCLVGLLIYEYALIRELTSKPPDDALRVRIVARQWWWEIEYLEPDGRVALRTANELHVPVGRPVAVTLESRDVIHSFWVPSLQGKVDVIPGRTNHVVFRADHAGTYRGQCAEFCGLQHANMAFYVMAEPPERFEAWLARQRRPALALDAPELRAGRDVFLNGPCVMCHTVRGTGAMASVAPDLTHLASRASLASGTLENTRGNLAAWIVDPQRTKPGTRMPATHLDRESLEALLGFLEALK